MEQVLHRLLKILDIRKAGVVTSAPVAPMIQSPLSKHIECVPWRFGGRPYIVGHWVRVQDIVLCIEQGMEPDDIVAVFPQLNLAEVNAAISYYFYNQETIDHQIAEGDEESLAAMRENDDPHLKAK